MRHWSNVYIITAMRPIRIGPGLQAKLLRIIQEREITPVGSDASIKVDIRVIASTNRDLKVLIKENKFREDLFFTINVVSLAIPPLRERKEDIPELALHFLNFFPKKITGI